MSQESQFVIRACVLLFEIVLIAIAIKITRSAFYGVALSILGIALGLSVWHQTEIHGRDSSVGQSS